MWELAKLQKERMVIHFKWVYALKQDSMGQIEQLKVRLVAKGFTQVECIDFTEVLSHV